MIHTYMPQLIRFFSKQKIKGEEKTCKKCEMRRAGQDVTPDIRHIRSCPDKHLEKKTYSKKCEYCDKIFSLENNRLFLRWWEDARSDYFAFIQDQTTGDTLKVLFEGSPRKGLTELSFNVSALSVGRPHRWLLTRKAERDTLQLMDFQFLSE